MSGILKLLSKDSSKEVLEKAGLSRDLARDLVRSSSPSSLRSDGRSSLSMVRRSLAVSSCLLYTSDAADDLPRGYFLCLRSPPIKKPYHVAIIRE